jgi:hypothetical protein
VRHQKASAKTEAFNFYLSSLYSSGMQTKQELSASAHVGSAAQSVIEGVAAKSTAFNLAQLVLAALDEGIKQTLTDGSLASLTTYSTSSFTAFNLKAFLLLN